MTPPALVVESSGSLAEPDCDQWDCGPTLNTSDRVCVRDVTVCRRHVIRLNTIPTSERFSTSDQIRKLGGCNNKPIMGTAMLMQIYWMLEFSPWKIMARAKTTVYNAALSRIMIPPSLRLSRDEDEDELSRALAACWRVRR